MPIYKIQGRKENGKQAYRVRVNFTDSSGKAKQLTRIAFGDKEAKQLEQSLLASVGDIPQDITLNELEDIYIESMKKEIRLSTLEKKQRVYNQWIRDSIGGLKLDKLTKQTLQEWKNRINETDRKTSYKRNIYAELRSVLNYGVRMDYIKQNNLNNIGNFRDTEIVTSRHKFDFYTAEEFKKFIEQADDPNYFVFFSIAFLTGMRKGEINALRWSDIDGDIIHVRRSVYQKVKGETSPKNRSSVRDIQMPVELVFILAKQRDAQSKETEFSLDYHVCGGHGILADTSIRQKNELYASKAGIKKIRIHDFRHSHASLLANNGINIQEIARRLGHSDITITLNTYSHLYPKESERALEVLNQIKFV